jgi:signal transduction histidine kinase
MTKRFIIICCILTGVLAGLFYLGQSALRMHEKGLDAERQTQFVAVAEQVRLDIKRTLNDFIQSEQNRPYTDYLTEYVPESTNQAAALVRSPLADTMNHGLAYGYFQIDNGGAISLPYQSQEPAQQEQISPKTYLSGLENQLLPALGGKEFLVAQQVQFTLGSTDRRLDNNNSFYNYVATTQQRNEETANQVTQKAEQPAGKQAPSQQPPQQSKLAQSRGKRMTIPLEETAQQNVQVIEQSGEVARMNAPGQMQNTQAQTADVKGKRDQAAALDTAAKGITQQAAQPAAQKPVSQGEAKSSRTVQIRIEPFVPLLVPYTHGDHGLFSGQVFLLRHIQIEQSHLIQGFQLNQDELSRQIRDSAGRFLREGMGFELSRQDRPDAAYTAILDFGFGEIGLHLLEREPGWIQNRVALLKHWFYAIAAVVIAAMTLSMVSLWRSLNEQVRLSKKKDDFISAVSHELRTPLTSIRMYAEMLEKEWVPTEEKRKEYYTGMRQETERLSRLIENVLDFSRIQRGKKQYQFVLGDVHDCLSQAAQLMLPCVKKAGFELHTEYAEAEPFMFDRDAVTQIVINLIDNACKYARPAADNHIILRTKKQDGYVLIEIEDHGPGVPRKEQARIFEAFYRCADESTRQAVGTGLGLALVKRFAEAHHGFVQLAPANPSGCVFRVGLSLSGTA